MYVRCSPEKDGVIRTLLFVNRAEPSLRVNDSWAAFDRKRDRRVLIGDRRHVTRALRRAAKVALPAALFFPSSFVLHFMDKRLI